MLVVGLTGGIGSGKTAVSKNFARYDVPIIDTDVIARELVAPGQPALKEIVEQFGSACINADGALDRAYLRKTIFTNPAFRKRLEAILHPRIHRAVRERVKSFDTPYCVVVVPLLVETGMTDLIDRILVVDVPRSEQVRRVMTRDGVDEAQAKDILAAQAGRIQRLIAADDIIDNSGSLAEIEAKVSALHNKYLKFAADFPPSVDCCEPSSER